MVYIISFPFSCVHSNICKGQIWCRQQSHLADILAVPCTSPSPGHLDLLEHRALCLWGTRSCSCLRKKISKKNGKKLHVGLVSAWDQVAAGNAKCPKLRYVWRYLATYFSLIHRASKYICEPIRAPSPVSETGQRHVLGHQNSVFRSTKLLARSLIWIQPVPPSCPQRYPAFGSECESGTISRRKQESSSHGMEEKKAEPHLHLHFGDRYPQAKRAALSIVTAWGIQEDVFKSEQKWI